MKALNPMEIRKVRRETLAENAGFQTKMILSAMCLALRKEFGFGHDRCLRVLESVEQISLDAFTAYELIEQCKNELGINLMEVLNYDD